MQKESLPKGAAFLKCSQTELEAMKRRQRSYIDAYPQIVKFHANPLLQYFDNRNLDYFVARKEEVKKITTKEMAVRYREEMKGLFRNRLISLPECSNEQGKVVATINKGEYLIDHVFIESQPGVFIAANFYYPKRIEGKIPAVLVPCGHDKEGKAGFSYSSFCVEAAMNGLCALTFDPIGQGERKIAHPEPADDNEWLSPVDAHCHIDRKLNVLGEHIASYFVADNCRALDYLLSRPEVDPERVAVSGNSGGGTMSAYMGAFDDRIKAIAPCCYINEYHKLLSYLMAQDAEQCIPDIMANGFDFSDFITAAAPKPYFIGAALFDFFPIEGVREAFVEAQQIYRLLGHEDHLKVYVASQGHGYWVDIRMQVLKFLCRHFCMEFKGNESIDYESLPTINELLCGVHPGTKPYIQGSIEAYIAAKAARSVTDHNGAHVCRQVLESLRINLDSLAAAQWVDLSEASLYKPGISVKDCSFVSEEGMMISGKIMERTNGTASSVLIYVGEWSECIKKQHLIDEFQTIFCVEPRGTGIQKIDPKSSFGMFDVEISVGYNARMLGDTLQGMRVVDLLAAIRLLRQHPDYTESRISIFGQEEHALTALYVAVIEQLDELYLENMLHTFSSFPSQQDHRWGSSIFGIGVGTKWDVDDLLADRLPGKIRIRGVLDHNKQRLDMPSIQEVYRQTHSKAALLGEALDIQP